MTTVTYEQRYGESFVATWTDEKLCQHERIVLRVEPDGSILTYPDAMIEDLKCALGWIAERYLQPLRRI